jgi:hypothetical protein
MGVSKDAIALPSSPYFPEMIGVSKDAIASRYAKQLRRSDRTSVISMISPLSSYALVTSFVIILKALFHSCFQD